MSPRATNNDGATREPGAVGFVQDDAEPATSADSTAKWGRNHDCDSGQTVTDQHQGEDFNRDGASSSSTRAMAVSGHVEDIWRQPGSSSDVDRLRIQIAERVYRSSRREPLGKAYQRGHLPPEKVTSSGFRFGVSSNKSEAAKGLVYPFPSNTRTQVSGNQYPPGEQLRRNYSWSIDVTSHRFGRSRNQDEPLRLGGGHGSSPRIVSKNLEDFRQTRDITGRVKNLGHASREHLWKHVYGKKTVNSGPGEWNARSCVEGSYTWAEQQPDDDLGKSITPGFRNAAEEGRAFGVPSIRSDIQPYGKRSIADTNNYGDDTNAWNLVNPNRFSSFGVSDEDFLVNRSKAEIRGIFEAIGYTYSEEVFRVLWAEAVGRSPGGGAAEESSIAQFQRVINDSLPCPGIPS